MSDSARIVLSKPRPAPPRSDADVFGPWLRRLSLHLQAAPNVWSPFIYRPDREADRRLIRLARTLPEHVRAVREAVAECDCDWQYFANGDSGPDPLAAAIHFLRDRLGWLFAEIEVAQSRTSEARQIGRDEANRIACKLARRDPAFLKRTARDWARMIGDEIKGHCSPATVSRTPLWQTEMARSGRGRDKGPAAKTVRYTEGIEATRGEGEQYEVLDQMVRCENEAHAKQAVNSSGMTPRERAETLDQLEQGDMTPEQAIEVAEMHPPAR